MIIRSPTHDPIMTIRPPLLMCLSAACVAMNVPRTLMSITRSNSSSVAPEFLWDGRAGIVHKDVEFAEGRDHLLDRGLDGVGVGGIRLDRDRLPADALDALDDRRRGVRALRVGDGRLGPIGGQTSGDRRADTTRAASDAGNLALELL